jgi:hydrogenase-4 component F
VAGNILAAYKTKSTIDVQGVMRVLPISGVLWVAGFLAIAGSPPFGPFLSELIILKAALDQGRIWVATSYLALLSVVFIGLATIMLRMAQGAPVLRPGGKAATFEDPSMVEEPQVESLLSVAPPVALGILVLILGLYLPEGLQKVLEEAAKAFTG